MKKAQILFFLIPLLFFSWVAANSSRLAGGEDGVMHHLFARYVPEHPANLLDHWAKPLYVFLSVPFAQFGLFGSLFFNVLLASLTSWLLFRTAQNLKLQNPWLAPVLLFGSTMYFYCVASAITEILFAFLLTWAFFESSRKKHLLAALIVSFLPFARSEGNGIIALFFLAFIASKQWKAIPVLATGTVLYSIAGSFYFDDIFWVWNQHPYGDASAIYGRGSLLHFVGRNKEIWGNPVYILWIVGTLLFAANLFIHLLKRKPVSDKFWIWLFMIFGSFYLYLGGHTLVWYLGKSGSLGLTRVIAAVMPACALMATYAVDRVLFQLNPNLKMLKNGIAIGIAFLALQSSWKLNRPPFHGDLEKEELIKAAAWFRESSYFENRKRIYYFAPTVAEGFRIDPFNPEQRGDLSEIAWNRDIPSGSIIVWDAHFGPNECHVPIDTLLQRPELELIYHQKPKERISTLNGYDYEIYLFRKP